MSPHKMQDRLPLRTASVTHILVAGVRAACGCGLHFREHKGGPLTVGVKAVPHFDDANKPGIKDRSLR